MYKELVIVVLFIILFFSGIASLFIYDQYTKGYFGPYVKIYQKVDISNLFTKTYNVGTYVFVYVNGNLNIQGRLTRDNVPCDKVKDEKEIQMKDAEEYKVYLEEKLKDYKPCEGV